MKGCTSLASRVFVSYSRRDGGFVRRELVPRLRAWGLEVIVDFESFAPGDNLTEAISGAVRAADHVVFVVTSDFLSSEWTRRELEVARASDPELLRRKCIPIVLDDTAVPEPLERLVWCDLTTDDREQAWRGLCEALGGAWAAPGLERSPQDAELRDRSMTAGSTKERLNALRMIVRRESRDAVPWLETIVHESKYQASRKLAVEQISKLAGATATERIKAIAEEHPNGATRRVAVELLVKSQSAAPSWMLDLISSDDDYAIRAFLAKRIREIARAAPDSVAPEIERVRQMAESESQSDVRHELIAATAFVDSGSPSLRDWLWGMVMRSKDPYYKWHCLGIALLHFSGDSGFLDELEGLTKQDEEFWTPQAKQLLAAARAGRVDSDFEHLAGLWD